MKKNDVFIHGIATEVPEKFYTQDFALDFMMRLQGDSDKKKAFLKRIYNNSAIKKRHSVIDDYDRPVSEYTFFPKNEKLDPEPSTAARNDLYISKVNQLAIDAVDKLLSQLSGFDKSKITHIITASCTGFSAPGVDFEIAKHFDLDKNVNRFHIGFMGCYAAFPVFKLAKSICESDPNARVLTVNAELCTVHFQNSFELDMVVSNAIFADGIGVSLISADKGDSNGKKIILRDFLSTVASDSESDMAWKIGDHGFEMKLSSYIPKIIDNNITGIMNDIFKRMDLKIEDIDIWAIHPGGKGILEKLEKTLSKSKEDFAYSYKVLSEYGNMSSATLLFVLNEILQSDDEGTIFAAGFGPGLTIETGILEKV